LVFLISMIAILFISIIGVLKPRLARNYSPDHYSTLYFEHIALNNKEDLWIHVSDISEERQVREISDQIFEISKILHLKNRHCSTIFIMLFINILDLVAYAYLISR
jgi:hypothetical protein